jgi:hypothetical protein
MDRKELLKSMLTNMIQGRDEEASADFHRYSKERMHSQYMSQTTAPVAATAPAAEQTK